MQVEKSPVMAEQGASNGDDAKIKYVVKRNGERQAIDIAQITDRLNKLAFDLERKYVNVDLIVGKVIQGMYDGITTSELDNLAAETCAYMNIIHPQYSYLAARIAVDNLHKNTKENFADAIKDLYMYIDNAGLSPLSFLLLTLRSGRKAALIAQDVYEIIQKNAERIQKEITYERDFTYDFFGFKTLERSYLLKINGAIVERPQHMLMRVSIGIHKEDLDSAFETYHLMSQKWFTHATPTLFNAGTIVLVVLTHSL